MYALFALIITLQTFVFIELISPLFRLTFYSMSLVISIFFLFVGSINYYVISNKG